MLQYLLQAGTITNWIAIEQLANDAKHVTRAFARRDEFLDLVRE